MKKENKGYNVNFVTNTVTVTKAFAQTAANNIFSEEFKIMKELREMGMTIVTKAPAKRKNDCLTYAKIEYLGRRSAEHNYVVRRGRSAHRKRIRGMRKLNTRLRRRTVAFAVLFLCAEARSSDGGGWRNRSFRRDLTVQDRKKSLPQTKKMLQPTATFLHLCRNFAHARALTGYTVM